MLTTALPAGPQWKQPRDDDTDAQACLSNMNPTNREAELNTDQVIAECEAAFGQIHDYSNVIFEPELEVARSRVEPGMLEQT